MAIIAVFAALLFVQEELLTFIPNVQLTVFLLVLYSKKLGFTKTSIIITIHVLLDNLVMGSFNVATVPFMWLGWMLIPLVICFLCKRVENFIALAFIGAALSFTYCWMFVIPSVWMYHMKFTSYMKADIVFELILAASSFISILVLYYPCAKALDKLLNKNEVKEVES